MYYDDGGRGHGGTEDGERHWHTRGTANGGSSADKSHDDGGEGKSHDDGGEGMSHDGGESGDEGEGESHGVAGDVSLPVQTATAPDA